MAITALSWIVAGQFARAERSCEYPLKRVPPILTFTNTKACLGCPYWDATWVAWA